MTTLEGIARQHGVAIAVAAVVDAKHGINGVSHTLLMQGILALRTGAQPSDYPEAVLACDNLALGAALKIPGISVIGVAAESDQDMPGLPIDVPCVIGVANLLQSISDGDILVVDGYKGVVHIDPDPPTLIHYQQAEEHRNLRETVFIASEHIPARTMTGETVFIYATVPDESQLAKALESGADGLVLDLRGSTEDLTPIAGRVLREAAGKPVVFGVDLGCEEILRAAMVYCTPGQVTLVSDNAEMLAAQVEAALDRVVLEALQLDIEPPQVHIGSISSEGVLEWAEASLVSAREIHEIEPIVKSGVTRVAVEPELVTEAKNVVRSVGAEDEP